MIKIILIGQENVGKSSIFNYFTKHNFALVSNKSGLTKDIQHAKFKINDNLFEIYDTYGIKNGFLDDFLIDNIYQCDVILYIIDGTKQINQLDHQTLNFIYTTKKLFFIIINKVDLINQNNFDLCDFNTSIFISIKQKININILIEKLLSIKNISITHYNKTKLPIVNIVGKPNSGKSTLMNRLLNQNCVKIDKNPGTTIDSIKYIFEEKLFLFDNPGIKKLKKNIIDYCIFSKTFETIKISNLNLFVIDYFEGITKIDIKIIKFILNLGKTLSIVINKSENNTLAQNKNFINKIYDQYPFLKLINIILISAKYGIGITKLKEFILKNINIQYVINNKILNKILLLLNNDFYLKDIKFNKIIVYSKNPILFLIKTKKKIKLNIFQIRYILKKIIQISKLKNKLIKLKFIN